jgi:hypothetical protein
VARLLHPCVSDDPACGKKPALRPKLFHLPAHRGSRSCFSGLPAFVQAGTLDYSSLRSPTLSCSFRSALVLSVSTPVSADPAGRRLPSCRWNREGQLRALCYQYGGDSQSGLQPVGSPENWRCVVLEKLSRVKLIEDAWRPAPNHSRPTSYTEGNRAVVVRPALLHPRLDGGGSPHWQQYHQILRSQVGS